MAEVMYGILGLLAVILIVFFGIAALLSVSDFGDSEIWMAIDEKIAKWIRGEK